MIHLQDALILRQGMAVSANPIAENGLQPQNVDVRVIVRKSVTAGEVLMFDIAQDDAAVSSATLGASDGSFRNVIAPTAQGISAGYPMCVATAVIADNAPGVVRVQGIISADLAGTNVVGDQLAPTTSGNLARALSGVGQRVVGWALRAGATEQQVYFDGLAGGMGAVQDPLPNGMQVPNIDFTATNRNGGTLVIGDVMMIDMALDSEAANFTLGATLSAWANVVVPDVAGVQGGWPLCVALEAPADNATGAFRLSGICAVNMDSAPSVGDDLTSDYGGADANALSATLANGDRVCGIGLTAADPASVLFEGRYSMGTPTVA